jgi:hypothetical protein
MWSCIIWCMAPVVSTEQTAFSLKDQVDPKTHHIPHLHCHEDLTTCFPVPLTHKFYSASVTIKNISMYENQLIHITSGV